MSEELVVGSRVECFERGPRFRERGTIAKIIARAYGVEFDKPLGLHSCDGTCKKGHGYYLSRYELVLSECNQDLERSSARREW